MGAMAIPELMAAVVAKYASADGATLRGKTPGGLWLTQTPTQATGTYLTVVPFPTVESAVMGTTAATIETILQFSACNTAQGSDGLVVDAAGSVRDLFHDVLLTMTDFRVLLAKFSGENLFRDQTSRGYCCVVKCRYLLGR